MVKMMVYLVWLGGLGIVIESYPVETDPVSRHMVRYAPPLLLLITSGWLFRRVARQSEVYSVESMLTVAAAAISGTAGALWLGYERWLRPRPTVTLSRRMYLWALPRMGAIKSHQAIANAGKGDTGEELITIQRRCTELTKRLTQAEKKLKAAEEKMKLQNDRYVTLESDKKKQIENLEVRNQELTQQVNTFKTCLNEAARKFEALTQEHARCAASAQSAPAMPYFSGDEDSHREILIFPCTLYTCKNPDHSKLLAASQQAQVMVNRLQHDIATLSTTIQGLQEQLARVHAEHATALTAVQQRETKLKGDFDAQATILRRQEAEMSRLRYHVSLERTRADFFKSNVPVAVLDSQFARDVDLCPEVDQKKEKLLTEIGSAFRFSCNMASSAENSLAVKEFFIELRNTLESTAENYRLAPFRAIFLSQVLSAFSGPSDKAKDLNSVMSNIRQLSLIYHPDKSNAFRTSPATYPILHLLLCRTGPPYDYDAVVAAMSLFQGVLNDIVSIISVQCSTRRITALSNTFFYPLAHYALRLKIPKPAEIDTMLGGLEVEKQKRMEEVD